MPLFISATKNIVTDQILKERYLLFVIKNNQIKCNLLKI